MKRFVLFFLSVVVLTSMTISDELTVGDKAPTFKAVDSQGQEWSLKNHLGKGYVVLFFYPAAMTGGCTQQACTYRDNMSDLEKMDVEVVGISGDKVEGLKIFKDEYDLNFTLLSDSDGSVSKQFGVPVKDGGTIEKTIGGKSVSLVRGATASRWTFVLDKKGTVIYKNQNVNVNQDTQQVMEAIKQHQAKKS